ncbi:MAG: EamA family transporter [Anaerolineae bacterium]|nr:EamA family transporter [Anaerolineae bacterium]
MTGVRAATVLGLMQVVVAAALWGTVGIGTKLLYSMAQTNALSVGFFRLVLSVPALALANVAALRARAWHVQRRDLPLMALIGAMMALYQLCYMSAVRYAGVTVAVLVTLCVAPVIVAMASALWLREPLTWRLGLAMVAALVGTALLIGLQPGEEADANVALGAVLALGSAAAYAVVTLVSRVLAPRYHPLQPLSIGFAVGAGALLVVGGIAGNLVLEYALPAWGVLVWLGLVPTALAYVLFLEGLKHTPATVASIAALAEPLTATLLAAVLFDEQLGPQGVIGALLLLSAIILLSLEQAGMQDERGVIEPSQRKTLS